MWLIKKTLMIQGNPSIKIFSNLNKIKNLKVDYEDKFVLSTKIDSKVFKKAKN